MPLPSLQDIEAAAQVVYRDFAPTPQGPVTLSSLPRQKAVA